MCRLVTGHKATALQEVRMGFDRFPGCGVCGDYLKILVLRKILGFRWRFQQC